MIFISGTALEEIAEIAGKGEYAQAAHLEKDHNDGLAKLGEVGGGIHHYQPGNAYGTGGGKQGVNKRQASLGSLRQHEQEGPCYDEKQEAAYKKLGRV